MTVTESSSLKAHKISYASEVYIASYADILWAQHATFLPPGTSPTGNISCPLFARVPITAGDHVKITFVRIGAGLLCNTKLIIN